MKAKRGNTTLQRKGYCYLDLFRSVNASLDTGIDVERAAEQFGPYPLVRRVVGFLISRVSCDVLIPCVRMVSPRMFHVDVGAGPIRLSDFIIAAVFSGARIGADSALVRSQNVGVLTSLCSVAGIPVGDVMAEAARRQIDKCMQLSESFVHDAVRPLIVTNQKKFEVPYKMNATVSAELQSSFPELNIVTTGRIAHPHAYAAAATLASEELILRKFKYDEKAAVERGYDAAIVDVGANYPRHAKAGRSTIHCCTPIIDLRDSARETTRQDTLAAAVRAGKLTAATANMYITPNHSTKQRCFHRAQNCAIKAPAMMFIHSQYDIKMSEFRDMLDTHKPRVVISVVNFLPAIFYADQGVHDILGVNFRRDGGDVIFDFVNDASMGYRHDLANLKEIYATQVVVTRSGRAYVCERFTRGCSLFLQYTYCSVAPEVNTLHASFSFWDTQCEGMVVLSTWDYDTARFAGSRLRTGDGRVGFTRKFVTVDRRFYDLLYAHCIRSGEKSFNFNECFSAGLTFNTKMCINGNDVRSVNRVNSEDFIHAVVAIYCIAYRHRFQAGKTIESFVACEKAKRSVRHVGITNFFGAAWMAVGQSRHFDGLRESWNALLEKIAGVYEYNDVDVGLFRSVRVVRFSELISLHAAYDNTKPAFEDLEVKKVMVSVTKEGLLGEVVELIKTKVAQQEVLSLPNDPVEYDVAPDKTEPVVKPLVSGRMLRSSITSFHSKSSSKTPENSKILTAIRHQEYVCDCELVVRRMPPDGHCVYHTLATIAGCDYLRMRRVLYARLHDPSIKILDGSRAGWGSTDAITAFTRIYGCRICVHIIYDGVPFATTCYTDPSVGDDAPLYHIRWTMQDDVGHVDLLVPKEGFEPLRCVSPVYDPEAVVASERDYSIHSPTRTSIGALTEQRSSVSLQSGVSSLSWDASASALVGPFEDYKLFGSEKGAEFDESDESGEVVLDHEVVIDCGDASVDSAAADFVRRYNLDDEFLNVPYSAETVWRDYAEYALSRGRDTFDGIDSLGIYEERVHYDLDSILSMLPGRSCAYVGSDVLPPSLADGLPRLDETTGVVDAIISTEYDERQFERASQLYIVRFDSPFVEIPDIPNTMKIVFRAKFTHVSDLTAYVAFCRPGRKFIFPDWYTAIVRSLNNSVRSVEPLDSGFLRMMLRGTRAGGLSDFLEGLDQCVEHDVSRDGCACCVYLEGPADPLVVQSLWLTLKRHAYRLRQLARTVQFDASRRMDVALLRYLDMEEARCARTGFTSDGLVGYSDVDRNVVTRAYDVSVQSYAHQAVKCSQPGTHIVECSNGKRINAETFGVRSRLTVEFAGSKAANAITDSATRYADLHADVRRTHTCVAVRDVPRQVRDVATSSVSGTVMVYPPRDRTLCYSVMRAATATIAVQTDETPCLPLVECPTGEAQCLPMVEVVDEAVAEPVATDVESPKRAKAVRGVISGAVKRMRKRLAVGTSVTSTVSDFDKLLEEKEELKVTRDRILGSMPVDTVSDVLATTGFWMNYPWDTKIHLVVVDTTSVVFPESFVRRRGVKTIKKLEKTHSKLCDDLYYNAEHCEFVLVATGDAESRLRAFFDLLPKDVERVSVEVSCPLSEAAFADAIVTLKRKVCLVTGRSQSWNGVLSMVNPDAKKLKPISAPVAFPKMTLAELGYAPGPPWIRNDTKDDAYKNSMIEFNHITAHADNFNKATFRRLNFDSKNGPGFGDVETLRSEGIYIFDNSPEKKTYLGTKPRQQFSHAYSVTADAYVPWNSKTERFDTTDRYVLVNRFTETMLNQQIIENIREIPIRMQSRPKIIWINGPPGCGKTYTIVQNAKMSPSKLIGDDLVLSMTKEGRESILQAMVKKYPGIDQEILKLHVRTVASVLVNGSKTKYARVLLDEALMAHAGTLGYVVALTGTKTALIIGDIHQIPYVDRDHMCELRYYSPACFADITSELSITYRCPMDVTYALHSLYNGLCTKSTVSTSMRRLPYSAEKAGIRKDLKNCLYLVHFQADKDALIREGCGVGAGSKVLTIHEAQGLTFDTVICVRTNSKALMLYDKVEYAVVAISRHTRSFTYYTDQSDAITRLLDRAKMDGAWLCEWNSKRLAVAKVPVLQAGGYIHEAETVLERVSFDTELNLASGLPQDNHGYLRPQRPHRIVNCLRDPPRWRGAAECDVAYMQAFYDSCMPGVSESDFAWDQMMMESEDTYLRATELKIIPGRGLYKPPFYGTLRPRLRTIMQRKKVRSQKESLLGAIKRNLNAPELANPALSPKELGYTLFENFRRSGIDPGKQHIFDAYRDDTVGISSPSIAEWLQKQPPGRQSQIVSELPLHLRPYNRFNYMVKTDVKPQLAPSAKDTYPSVQTIIYNEPSVNAIFCPIFNILFERLLSVLHPKILLLTGMSKVEFEREINARISPQLAAHLRTVEDDFSKFDKAQQEALRVLEDLLWRALGLDADLAEIWDVSRRRSFVRDRDGGIAFETRFQRKSGEATTFSGNTLVSVCVILGIFDIDDIVLLLAAGDDTLVYLRDGVEVTDASRLIADLFNLECKLLDRYRVPYFCSAFIVPTQNWTYVVPDPLKFVTKLGRQDMKNYQHVEEYRVSCIDTMQSLFNAEVTPGLSLAVVERYGTFVADLSKLQSILRTLCYDPKLFASLFVHDRSVVIYDPSNRVRARHVTVAL